MAGNALGCLAPERPSRKEPPMGCASPGAAAATCSPRGSAGAAGRSVLQDAPPASPHAAHLCVLCKLQKGTGSLQGARKALGSCSWRSCGAASCGAFPSGTDDSLPVAVPCRCLLAPGSCSRRRGAAPGTAQRHRVFEAPAWPGAGSALCCCCQFMK